MKQLVRATMAALVYLCVGTVIAEAIVLCYTVSAWHLTRDRALRMLAVAQGVELPAPQIETRADAPDRSQEQVSYDQVLESRAVKFRGLELREQSLRNAVDQLRVEQGKLTAEQRDFQDAKEGFQKELLALKKQTIADGWEQSRAALAAAKPKQAKQILWEMLDRNEIEVVVSLLRPMNEAKRAKILAEFKTPEEIRKINDILALMRRAEPLAATIDKTQQQLGQSQSPLVQGSP
jgi:hypothetical protein